MRYLSTLIFSVFFFSFLSCSDDDNEMEYAKVYFPLATRADANGIFSAEFNYARDTTFIIRAYCAGSVLTPEDITVNIELATAKFQEKQQSDPVFSGYELLPADAYVVEPADLNLVIKKNTEGSDLKIRFHMSKLTEGKKYMLPLNIKSSSHYEISDKYSLLFFAIQQAD